MKNNITYGIDVEAELTKILNKQIYNSIRKDFRIIKIKRIWMKN